MSFLAVVRRVMAALRAEPLYGVDLAERVAELLDEGGSIANCHAYYCGTGFVRQHDRYCWCHIDDGYPGEVLKGFESRAEFVAWLAAQSDASLEGWSGGDGRLQIPGRARMRREVTGLRDKPAPRDDK